MIYKIAHRALLAVLLSFILLVCSVHAQTITGKVVGVADGDTITVLQDRTQYKILSYGVDYILKDKRFGFVMSHILSLSIVSFLTERVNNNA